MLSRWHWCVLASAGLALAAGCGVRERSAAGDPRVVVYTSLDEEYSRPVMMDYMARTGVEIVPQFDTESTKSVGLTQKIVAEAARPRCDLFWNNEIVNTLRLKEKGLLAPFDPPNAAPFPPEFRAKDGTWYGFAARARILLVNTQVVPEAKRPKSIRDLLDPNWKGKIGLAKPLFGTTATHAACLFVAWGPDEAKRFFRELKANDAQVLSGNKQVANAVGSGQLAFGLTDTDDAMGELRAGSPVAIIYPDREPDQLGTLFIPNTLAILKGAPHRAAAEALANFLLGPEVEATLARGESAQVPLNPQVEALPRIETPRTVHAMPADFEAAVRAWDETTRFLEEEFTGG